MSDGDDRHLAEARDLIGSTDKTFGLILIAALIWWVANLFPFNLSERSTRSFAGRLEKLQSLGKDVEKTCSSAIETYAGLRADALLKANTRADTNQTCLVRLPGSKSINDFASRGRILPEGDKAIRNEARQQIVTELRESWGAPNTKKTLDTLEEHLKQSPWNECKKIYETTHEIYFKSCIDSREKFVNFVDSWTKEGNIDVVGLKVNNINARWHPIALILILLAGVLWIGFRRRRILGLIDMRLKAAEAKGEDQKAGWLMRVPWWLLPVPQASYSSRHTLREFVASEEEYKRSWMTGAIILAVLLAMLASGLHAQKLLSISAISPDLRELGEFESASLGLLGSAVLDLFFLTALVSVPVAFLWWILPPKLGQSDIHGRMSGSRRQALWAMGSVAAFSIAVPLAAMPDTLKSISLRGRSKPYWKKKRKVVNVSLSPGWYWNQRSRRKFAIGHFVKPEIIWKRPARLWPPRLSKTMQLAAGRIKGIQKIDARHLVEMKPAALMPPSSHSWHVNKRAYSDGFEAIALQKWRDGKRDEAIGTLRTGLNYSQGGKLNIRLYDLLAGLLVRGGRDQEVSLLIPAVQEQIARIDRYIGSIADLTDQDRIELHAKENDKKRRVRLAASRALNRKDGLRRAKKSLEKRLEAWGRENGKWKTKWRAPSCRWSGLDI